MSGTVRLEKSGASISDMRLCFNRFQTPTCSRLLPLHLHVTRLHTHPETQKRQIAYVTSVLLIFFFSPTERSLREAPGSAAQLPSHRPLHVPGEYYLLNRPVLSSECLCRVTEGCSKTVKILHSWYIDECTASVCPPFALEGIKTLINHPH